MIRYIRHAVALLCLMSITTSVSAVIILGDINNPASPYRNTIPPNPPPSGLGNYVGTFGSFLGTPISSRYFITATHIGSSTSGGIFRFNNGGTTTTAYNVTLAGTLDDLAIWKVADNGPGFTLFAPLYTASTEVGNPLVTIGTGGPRGSPVIRDGQLRGWQWGAEDDVISWGTNTVTSAIQGNIDGFRGRLLRFTFDNNGDPNEASYAGEDSGGPVFVRDPADGMYKLAGIGSLVELVRQTPNQNDPLFQAALFDARGFYNGPDLITGPNPVPLGSIATDISSRIAFITSIPEPSTLALSGLAAAALIGSLYRRRRGRSI
jgi:hypothetical protein